MTSLVAITLVYAVAEPLPWLEDEKAVQTASRERSLPVLVYLHFQPYAYWGLKFEKTTLSDADLQAHLRKNYVLWRIDVTRQPKLGERFETEGYPTLVILDAMGKQVWKRTGYVEADKLLKELKSR